MTQTMPEPVECNYQSKRRCAKTNSMLFFARRMCNYQSKRRCAKTMRGRLGLPK